MGETQPAEVTVAIASRMQKYLAPLSRPTITRMCVNGVFKTAHKKGPGKTSQWFISGAEIIQYKLSRHATINY